MHFFYTPGILPLPYHFYNHRVKNICDPGQKFFFFFSITDHQSAVRATSRWLYRAAITNHPPCASMLCDCTHPLLCSVSTVLCSMLCWSCVSCRRPMAGNGGEWQVPSQIQGLLPIPTNAPDQTKNHVVLHVESPTKPYQDPCPLSVCHWCVWLGQGSAYQVLPCDRSGCVPFSCSITTHYRPRS